MRYDAYKRIPYPKLNKNSRLLQISLKQQQQTLSQSLIKQQQLQLQNKELQEELHDLSEQADSAQHRTDVTNVTHEIFTFKIIFASVSFCCNV